MQEAEEARMAEDEEIRQIELLAERNRLKDGKLCTCEFYVKSSNPQLVVITKLLD